MTPAILPWIGLGLVVGAMAPAAGAGWWFACVGVPLAVIGALTVRRLPVASCWLLLAAAMLCGRAIAPLPVAMPTDAVRLVAVRGEVASVAWQGHSQGFALVDLDPVMPADWRPPRRLFIKGPAVPGVRPGDLAEVRGRWSVDDRGERIDAVAVTVVPREDGPRAFAWRALAGVACHRELAGSLLVGRGAAPEAEAFREAGLMHVLAVSGMHLAIAAALLFWLLRALGLGWAARLWAMGALLVGYTWLTGAAPATVRALAMALAVILYERSLREPHPLGPVSLAALVLVAWDPVVARDIGFQLSLVAVLGIVTLGMDLVRLRQRVLPLAPWPLDRPTWRVLLWCGGTALDSLAIGIGAGLATLPLVAWWFGQAAPWSFLTSLVAGIPATIALWTGLPLIALAGAWPAGPWEGLYALLDGSLSALVAAVQWSAAVAPRQWVAAPQPVLLVAWPMLFLPLRTGRDLMLRVGAVAAFIALWRYG